MKALIFSAGLGTRFKPWTDKHPKALAVVNNKSLLQRNIEYLQQYGITNVVVNVHHFADQIEKTIADNKGWGSHVLVSDERAEVLETGGGLLKAKDLLGNQRFLTINVDILTDLDLQAMLAAHKAKQSLVTLAVTDRKTSRYLLFDQNNRLCGWRNTKTGEEKIPVQTEPLFEKAYSGVAVFEPQIFEMIAQRGKFSLIDVYLSLARDHKIYGFNHTGGKLIDVGKPESVAVAEELFS
jgi:N-acetyl-alpha-D-muramate 1-phosphate uridylyltransferase